MLMIKIEPITANGKFARADSKKTRSVQYSISQTKMEVRIALGIHGLPANMLHNRMHPTMPQPAPVMDKYNGLTVDRNSTSTVHQRKAA
jgi:hypothetical protein